MKCKDCQKKIAFDHYLGTTGPTLSEGSIQLVFKCDCGLYLVPFDLVQVSKGRGLISSGKMIQYKVGDDRILAGKNFLGKARRFSTNRAKRLATSGPGRSSFR